MRIELRNHTSTVIDASQTEIDFLYSYLVIKTVQFKRDYYTGRAAYDGEKWEHLYDIETQEFPAGFTSMVARRARELGFAAKVVDCRGPAPEPNLTADLGWLRDYQRDAVDAAVLKGRGIIQAGTGAGKTEVIAALTTRVYAQTSWLILVHRKNLMKDIGARLEKRAREHGMPSPDVGFYGDGTKDLGHRITIASFDSLRANAKNPEVKRFLAHVEAVLIDEAHTLAADTFTRIVQKCTNAYLRFGVSGTPLSRGDKRSPVAVGLLGPVIFQVTAQELIGEGHLARALVRMVKYDAEDVYSAAWNIVRDKGIVGSAGRNRAVLGAVRRARKPALVFVDIVEHGRLLSKAIKKIGINCEFVWGIKKTEERVKALKRLESGEVDVIVCSSVFNEGIDLPSLGAVVLAAGGKSVIAMLQRIGRGMRPGHDGTKFDFEVWDFEDRTHRILEDHMNERKKAYKREGHEVETDSQGIALSFS